MKRSKVGIIIAASFTVVGFVSCSKIAPSNTTTSKGSKAPPTTESSPTTQISQSAKPPELAEAIEDFNSRKYEKSASSFDAIAKADPKNIDARIYLGKSYRALKKDDDAIAVFQEALELKADHAEANFYLGNIYYDRSDYQASLPFFEQAVKSKNNSSEYLMALGDNQRMLKQYDRAIVQYGRVIGFEPNNAKAYYNLGLTYIGLNNKIGATQQARKLESLDKELAKKLTDAIGDK